jgi:uncharacterized membrane protein HdeD (DUF308 family)
MRTIGIVLVIAGILMLVFRGINFTTEKEVVDLGPLEINKKERKSVNWPLYAGIVVTLAGIVMVVADKRKA